MTTEAKGFDGQSIARHGEVEDEKSVNAPGSTNRSFKPEQQSGIDNPPGGTSTNALDEIEYPTNTKFWLIILTVAAVLVLGSLDINIVATAVPSITDDFHSFADLSWYLSAFRLSACAFQFVFGKAYKLFSIKRVFLLANAFFSIGSLLCATAATSSMLIFGRAVAGFRRAGLLSGCFTILIHSMPLRRRPMFVGVLGGLESLAVIAAPLLGGVLTQALGWRWCFWINLPIGGLTILLAIFFVPHGPKSSDRNSMTVRQKVAQLDLVSNLLFLPAITSLFIALSWAGTRYSWSDGKVIGLLVTFAVLLLGFSYNQHRLGDIAVLPPLRKTIAVRSATTENRNSCSSGCTR